MHCFLLLVFFRSMCYECVLPWARIVASFMGEEAHFETCMKCTGGLSFGGEINCMAMAHVGNADYMKSVV